MVRILFFCLIGSLFLGSAWAADKPVYTGSKRVSTPEDRQAIERVVEDFRQAIIEHDGKKLSKLILNSRILFASPGDQKSVDATRAYDVNFDGVGVGGFNSFVNFISTSKDRLEERFYNVDIKQDGVLAWVNFDYEFYENDKLSNYGVEAWQLHKTDGVWKIFSVVWSSHSPAS